MREGQAGATSSRWTGAAFGLAAIMVLWTFAGTVGEAKAATVTGGNAVLNLDRDLVKRLSSDAVRVDSVRPARLRRTTLRLGFAGGNFEVATNNPAPLQPLAIESINGQASLRGGLRLTRRSRGANRSVRLVNLRVNLAKRRVSARIGRRNVALFKLNLAWATPTGVNASRPRLLSAPMRLTPAAARQINRALGRRVVRKNLPFGHLNLAPTLASG